MRCRSCGKEFPKGGVHHCAGMLFVNSGVKVENAPKTKPTYAVRVPVMRYLNPDDPTSLVDHGYIVLPVTRINDHIQFDGAKMLYELYEHGKEQQ